MTLLELKKIIDNTIESNNRNPERILVTIPNNKSGLFGGTPTTDIKSAGMGFDWDANVFFLNPESPMKEMGLKDKLEDL